MQRARDRRADAAAAPRHQRHRASVEYQAAALPHANAEGDFRGVMLASASASGARSAILLEEERTRRGEAYRSADRRGRSMIEAAADTVEEWAARYIASTDLDVKLAPPLVPKVWTEAPSALRVASPGRPAALTVTSRARKSPSGEALRSPEKRAELVHTFLHHELQAAELMAWALLAFPDTPRAFKVGLLGVLADEVRHMALYRDYLRALGFDFGSFPVRDWFWERVPSCPSAIAFVALMGIGFEGGNLDHTERFAERFRAVGDVRGAELQVQIGEEEIPHVRFALTWFRKWTGGDDFDLWLRHLPPPLTPTVMRGLPINRARRLRSGMSESFVDAIERWSR
jgi:uncharacterized ferritin-like protein (DUF455 family)